MNNLEEFEPRLTNVSKESPYRVPEGYFNSLPSRVQAFCKKQEVEAQKVSWIVTFKPQLTLAASICLFLLLAGTGFYYTGHTNNLSLFERTDYIKIVVESGTEFDEIQLYEAVTNGVKKEVVKKPMNDELIDYLLYDNFENGTLLEKPKDIKP